MFVVCGNVDCFSGETFHIIFRSWVCVSCWLYVDSQSNTCRRLCDVITYLLSRPKCKDPHVLIVILAQMPSPCSGPLCTQNYLAGASRRRGETKYAGLCASYHHHVCGTQIQARRAAGSSHSCRNWPQCSHWFKSGCNGFCVSCFKSVGGVPNSQRKDPSLLTRHPLAPPQLLLGSS